MRFRALLACILLTTSCAPMQAEAKLRSKEVPLISITSDITSTTADGFQKILEAVEKEHPKYILIEIDSLGGDVYAGFRMAKAIEAAHAGTVCVVDEMAASMAFYILQSCGSRFMTKRASLMVHEPHMASALYIGELIEYQNYYNELKASADAMVEHEAKRMKISVADLSQRIARSAQWWMNWREAWQWGAVDAVVESSSSVRETLQSGKSIENLAGNIGQVNFPSGHNQ